MAVNTKKRVAVKWVRDAAKSAYKKGLCCYICGSKEELELHHLNSITLLLGDWASKKGYDISTDEGILAVRHEFIAAHHRELYVQVYTLCNKHHMALHDIYGKVPPFSSVEKQDAWIKSQREKQDKPLVEKLSFAQFC
jgi:hypothetical protein